jgi:hypothetical protein
MRKYGIFLPAKETRPKIPPKIGPSIGIIALCLSLNLGHVKNCLIFEITLSKIVLGR